MGSSGAPPSYPGLSDDEKRILQKQGITLDQFNNILSNENVNATENQQLLKQLSGLYDTVDTAATPASVKYSTKYDRNIENLKPFFGKSMAEAAAAEAANGKPGIATYLSQQGYGSYADAENVYDTFKGNAMLGKGYTSGWNGFTADNPEEVRQKQAVDLSLKYGLGEYVAPTEAGTKQVLNQQAIEDLRKRVAAGQATQQELTDLEQGTYKSGLEALQRQLPQIEALNKLTLDRQQRALEGTLPVSQGLLDRKAEDFKHLQESAARRGITIAGDTPETATSQSSAGNELMGQFNRTYGLLTDQERRGEITGAPNQVYTPGPASQTPSYGTSLGFGTAPGAGGLLGQYGQLASQYGGAMSPYTSQRNNSYQGVLNSYMQGQSNDASTYQAGATLLGMML